MAASLEFDRFPGFTAWDLDREAVWIAGMPDAAAVALEDGVVCGLVCPRCDDLTVHPDYRRRGHGRRLFEAGIGIAARAGWDELRLYVPPETGTQSFARAMEMAYRSSLWQLSLRPGTPVPEPALPAWVTSRTLADPVRIDRYIEMLNAAFRDHPSPMSWTVDEVEYAHSRPGFDPTATLLLFTAERPDEPIALVRTVLAPPEEGEAPAGEVLLVGVLPEWRGRGLGRELLRHGVARLRGRGAGVINLTVEADNELALGLYRRNGFEPSVEWPHWARRTQMPDSPVR
jgi:mycothiol synthase